MKVSLVFPPQAQPFLPHPALPILASILRKEGIEVALRDFNLEAYLHFLSPPALEQLGMTKDFANHVTFVLGQLRSGQEFLDQGNYFRAIQFVQNCLGTASSKYQGVAWNLKAYSLRDYSAACWDDIRRASVDSDSNLFIDYYQSRMAELKAEEPQLVGITVAWEAQLIPAITLARMVKQHIPGVRVVLGGSMISHLIGYFERMPQVFSFVDYFLPFQGEAGIVPLVRALEGQASLEEVPGLVYLSSQDQVQSNPSHPAKTMTLPIPDFAGLPLESYLSPRIYLPLVASRGCYYAKCAFCSHHISGMNFNAHRVDEVLAEMDTLHEKHGCRDFYFADDSLPPALALKIAHRITEGNKPYRWMGEMRFEKIMSPEYFQTLYAGGARVLLFGLESGNDRVAGLMGKGTSKSHAARMLEAASQAGIVTWVFFFLGFPGETEEEGRETMEFLLENRKHIDMIAGGPFVLTRNSPIFDTPEKFSVARIVDNEKLDLQLAYDYLLQDERLWDPEDVLGEYGQRPEMKKFQRPFSVEPHMLFFKKASFGVRSRV